MKKILSLLFLLFLFGCTNANAKFDENNLMSEKEINSMFSSADEYKGRSIIITGKIFTEPEDDGESLFIQANFNPKDSEGGFIVTGPSGGEFKTDDYIKVKGIVSGAFEYENAFGGTLSAPMIVAESIDLSSYEEAEAPALKSIKVNKTINKKGVKITLNRIDFAKNETRVYLSIKNNTKYDANIYTYSAKLVDSNRKQHSQSYSYNYPDELESDLSKKTKSSGPIFFKALNFNKMKYVEIKLDGSLDDYNYSSLKYNFKVKID